MQFLDRKQSGFTWEDREDNHHGIFKKIINVFDNWDTYIITGLRFTLSVVRSNLSWLYFQNDVSPRSPRGHM